MDDYDISIKGKSMLYDNNNDNSNDKDILDKIPKNIFQTWADHTFSDCRPMKIIEMNPNYNYWLFNDTEMEYFMNNIMKDEFDGNLTKAFNLIDDVNGAAKADIWRYAVLWKYGGVYIDFDAVCWKSFDDMIKSKTGSKFIVSFAKQKEYNDLNRFLNLNTNNQHDPNENVLKWLRINNSYHTMRTIQWMIISAPKSIILTRVIQMVIDNILNPRTQRKYKLNDPDVDMQSLTRKVTGPETLRYGMTDAVLKHNLRKGIDYEIYGALWRNHCKHYHAVKGFYHRKGIKRYNHIKHRPFLKQPKM